MRKGAIGLHIVLNIFARRQLLLFLKEIVPIVDVCVVKKFIINSAHVLE